MGIRHKVGAAVGALVLAGTMASAGGTAGAQSSNINRNATVRYTFSTAPGGWDPARGRNQFQDELYMNMVYDRLVQLDENGDVQPLIATRWSFSPDGKTITFAVRQGMKFHDGTPVTAAAVARSIMRSKTLSGSSTAFQLVGISRVDAPNPSTVVIHMRDADPAIMYILASTAGMVISPKALDSNHDLIKKPAGSGPYTLRSAGVSGATYDRNEAYYDKSANPAKVRRMVVALDPEARLNILRGGQADAGQLSSNEWPSINAMQKSGRFNVNIYNTTNIAPMYLNSKIKPLDNPKVRLALNLAINRDAINQRLMYGKCPPASATFQRGTAGYVPNLEYKYDVNRAKQLLREAGVGNGFTLRTLATQTEPYFTFTTAIRDMLDEIGVKLNITRLEPAAIRPTFRAGQHAAAIQAFSSVSPDASTMIDGLYLGPDNPGGTSQFFANRAARAKKLPLGSVARRQAYEQLNKMMFDEPQHIFICRVPNIYVSTKKVVGADRFAYSNLAPIADIRYLALTR